MRALMLAQRLRVQAEHTHPAESHVSDRKQGVFIPRTSGDRMRHCRSLFGIGQPPLSEPVACDHPLLQRTYMHGQLIDQGILGQAMSPQKNDDPSPLHDPLGHALDLLRSEPRPVRVVQHEQIQS